MENKLGRKSMAEWLETMQGVMGNLYNDAFQAGYDVAKIETPDVDEMAELLIERYTDVELDTITALLHDVISHKVVKSANEQRSELIQRAREFVEEQRVVRKGKKFYISPCLAAFWCSADFVVNADKRTVVCLLKSASDNVKNKGIAKCMPDEVFNADIGKAIALARALEIDVLKEFVNAVQPDEVVVGMQVQPIAEDTREEIGESLEVSSLRYSYPGFEDGRYASSYKIIDDTNAKY